MDLVYILMAIDSYLEEDFDFRVGYEMMEEADGVMWPPIAYLMITRMNNLLCIMAMSER